MDNLKPNFDVDENIITDEHTLDLISCGEEAGLAYNGNLDNEGLPIFTGTKDCWDKYELLIDKLQ